MVPHTHDDVGWLSTVDEYFIGLDNKGRVDTIISGAIDELLKDSRRKFTYTEMKFFSLWYNRQTEKKRNQVKELVKNG